MKRFAIAAIAAAMLLTGCSEKMEPVSLKALQPYTQNAADYASYKQIEIGKGEDDQPVTLQNALDDQTVIASFEIEAQSDLPQISVTVYSYQEGKWIEVLKDYALVGKPTSNEILGLVLKDQSADLFSGFANEKEAAVKEIPGMKFIEDRPIAVSVKDNAKLNQDSETPIALVYQAKDQAKLEVPTSSFSDMSYVLLDRMDYVYGIAVDVD